MLSNYGKRVTKNFQCFFQENPVAIEERRIANIDKKEAKLKEAGIKNYEEEIKRSESIRDNIPKKLGADLGGFIKRINQQKSQVFTNKANSPSKLSQRRLNTDSNEFMIEEADDMSHVDIEYQVQEAQKLVESIQMKKYEEEKAAASARNNGTNKSSEEPLE